MEVVVLPAPLVEGAGHLQGVLQEGEGHLGEAVEEINMLNIAMHGDHHTVRPAVSDLSPPHLSFTSLELETDHANNYYTSGDLH